MSLPSEFLSCTLPFIKKNVELPDFPFILALLIIQNILDDIQGMVQIIPVNKDTKKNTYSCKLQAVLSPEWELKVK